MASSACAEGEARALRGRLLFCVAQVFGKTAGAPLPALQRFCDGPRPSAVLGDDTAEALHWFARRLAHGRPREVKAHFGEAVLALTDGVADLTDALGQPYAGIGGVIYAPGGVVEYFSLAVPEDVADEWTGHGERSHVNGQAGLFPVVVAKLVWVSLLREAPALYSIDNVIARQGTLNGGSASAPSARLVA